MQEETLFESITFTECSIKKVHVDFMFTLITEHFNLWTPSYSLEAHPSHDMQWNKWNISSFFSKSLVWQVLDCEKCCFYGVCTCDQAVWVSWDARGLLLSPPDVQQQLRRAGVSVSAPAQQVCDGLGILTQLQQRGHERRQHASGAPLRATQANTHSNLYKSSCQWPTFTKLNI